MASLALRGAAAAGRYMSRYAPQIYDSMARSYYRNPNAWHNVYGAVTQYGAPITAAAVNMAKNATRGRPKGSKNKPKEITPAPTRKAKAPRYRTSGYMDKQLKGGKGVKKSQSKASTYGAVKIIENGGVLSTSSLNSIYPFHGTASDQVINVAFMALVKELMRQRKTDIISWSDVVPYNSTLNDVRVTFRWINKVGDNPVSGTPSSTDFNLPVGDTFYEMATGMLEHWKINNGAGSQPKELIQLILTDVSTIPLANLYPQQINFEFECNSIFKLQNRTLAEDGAGDADRDEAEDIENNPLTGYLYTNTGSWGNFFEPQRGVAGGNNLLKSSVVHRNTGVALLNSVNDMSAGNLKKPPPAFVLGFKKQKRIYLNPGAVHSHKLYFKTTISFHKFFEVFAHILASTSTDNPKISFGNIAGFGLEKVLDAQRSAGTNISIGYEINQRYMCTIHKKKAIRANPLNEVGETAINVSTDTL